MKKTLKRTLTLLLAAAMLFSVVLMSGCNYEDSEQFNEKADTTRTQIYVGYFNGGLGLQWIEDVKDQFEALYPEYQIMIDTGKDEFQTETLLSNIKTNRQDMYVVDGADYYKMISNGVLKDITEAVTTPLTEFGEEASIADKMNESLRGFYYTNDQKYYAVPLYQSAHHIIYDVDLFDQYLLWFKDGGGFVNSLDDKKSAGQDGEYGTWDDGLPVTYSDFFTMMDRMVARGITPMTWTGQYADEYLTNFVFSLVSNYEGEEFRTDYSYEGEATVITNRDFTESAEKTFALNAADTEKVTVTTENFADYMYGTAGKYFAVKFCKDLASNPAYRKYNYAESHTAVQRSYLMSNMAGVDAPIAMLIEGGWWMNEASSVFDEMATYDAKYSKENRRFGVMPLPKSDDYTGTEGQYWAPFSGTSAVFISPYSKNQEGATLFFRYMHSEQALQTMTRVSGVLRPYTYDTNAIYDQVPYYVQSVIDAAANTTFVFKVSTGSLKEDYTAMSFMTYGGFLATRWNNITSANPIIFFCDNASATAKDYFLGIKEQFTDNIPTQMK